MREVIRKILAIMDPRDRKNLGYLIVGMVMMGVVEVLMIVSVIPFIAVVSKADVIQTNNKLKYLYDLLAFNDQSEFLVFLGLIVLAIIVLGNAYLAFMTWLMLRFAHRRGHTISRRLLSRYLSRDYSYFLGKNSSELTKNILGETARVITGVMLPLLQVTSRIVVALFILGLLLVVDPVLAMVTLAVLGVAYIGIYLLVKKKLVGLGAKSVDIDRARFKSVGEVLQGIKDIKLLGVEEEFLNRFSWYSLRSAHNRANNQVISMLPKFALESVAFGGILIIILYMLTKKDAGQIIPVIALYAFAGYRMMPSLQRIFIGVSSIKYNSPSLDVLHRDICEEEAEIGSESTSDVQFIRGISLRDVYYGYQGSEGPAIRSINIDIKPNTIVGFAGRSGSGKTTTIDVILGLLIPDQGAVYVDNVQVARDNVKAWQSNIGYVPQAVYLADDSVANNIAFGVPEAEVDIEAVENAARIANIHDFIINELPSGYHERIGERGVRLSGGQKQRIGIARAIYRRPKLLVLDEATSALDSVSEKEVVNAVAKLSSDMTIIMIAHRLSTLMYCDVIYVLDHGEVVGAGTYEDLKNKNEKFMSLIMASEEGR